MKQVIIVIYHLASFYIAIAIYHFGVKVVAMSWNVVKELYKQP